MKKIIILVTLLLFTFNYSRAQEDNPPPVQQNHGKAFKSVLMGVKASPNIGWLNPDSKKYESEGVIFGFSWGFMCEFAFTKNYSFVTGFNVIASNGKLNYPHMKIVSENSLIDTLTGKMSREYKLRYLEIPLTLKMRTRDFGKFSFYGQIGLGAGFNIRAKSSDEFSYDIKNRTPVPLTALASESENIKDQVTFFRLGLLIGAGAEFSLGGTTRLMAGFNYNNGLFDILTKKNTVNNSIEEDAKSSFVDFTLGILF